VSAAYRPAHTEQERDVAQQLAVVTGASSGIGAATALLLGAQGWRVVLVARGRPALEQVAARIAAVGPEPAVEPLDGADADAVLAMAARVLATHGVPGALVNAAGAGEWRWLEDTPPDDMERMLDAPFRAAYHHTYAFLRPMLDQRAGVIVHVGSPAAYVPWPSSAAYTCARWALRGLHEALRQDLHGTGVHSCHAVFATVASAYWDHNPGTYALRPGLGRLLRTLPPNEAAEAIVRVIHRPRDEVVLPGLLRAAMAAHHVAPGPLRGLTRVTGRRR
jgi:uncharacterized protein